MKTLVRFVGLGLAMVLTTQAIQAAQEQRSGSGAKDGRLICRRIVETGSLVKAQRQCFTREQWDRIASKGRDDTQTMRDYLSSRPAGN